MHFYKMHGAGNDYIYFNCMEKELANPEEIAILLSDRNKGIGGDGIVMICKSIVADAKMRMFNIDGSEGKMCGNAIRCVSKFLYDYKIVNNNPVRIETLSGIKTCNLEILENIVNTVTVDMGRPSINPKDLPVLSDNPIINQPINVLGETYFITCVSMGNPHQILFLNEIEKLDLNKIGKSFENYYLYPEKVNTEFIKIINNTTIDMRVWERGSGETLACGTGACAAVVAATLNNLIEKEKEITVNLKGGTLFIKYINDHVYMRGPAVMVFEGDINI